MALWGGVIAITVTPDDDQTPIAPTNLVATTLSSSSIDVDWDDNATNEDGYRLYRHDGDDNFVLIADENDLGPGSIDYTDTGLVAGVTYTYRVQAVGINMELSAFSNEDSATTTPAIPDAAPSNCLATNNGPGEVVVTWQDNSSNEDTFGVERQLGAGAFVEIAEVTQNVEQYVDNDVAFGTGYTYRIRAKNATGNSGYSNSSSVTTIEEPPDAPSSLSATGASSTTIDLTWVDNSSNEDNFAIERRIFGSGNPFVEIHENAANDTTYTDTVASGHYEYRVLARNSGGDSAYSNSDDATTLSAPTAPSGLTAVWDGPPLRRVVASWIDNSSNEDEFEVQRRKGDSGSWSTVATPTANSTFYLDTSFSPPATPTGLIAVDVHETEIDLSWNNVAGEDGYVIEYKTAAQGAWTEGPTTAVNVTTVTLTGLVSDTDYNIRVIAFSTNADLADERYDYRVRASNLTGDSTWSNIAEEYVPREDSAPSTQLNVTTDALTIPAAPSALGVLTISSNELQLSWTDNSDNEDDFRIERAPTSSGPWVQIATVGVNQDSYNNGGLDPDTTYYYRVRARNSVGNSNFSNIANGTTDSDGGGV